MDVATVSDQELENDAVIYMCLKKESTFSDGGVKSNNPHHIFGWHYILDTDQWEDIQVAKIELDHHDSVHNNNRAAAQ